MEPCPIRSSFRFSFKDRSASISFSFSLLFFFKRTRIGTVPRGKSKEVGEGPIGFSESEECSSQSSDRSLSANEESFRDDSSLTVQY